MTDDYKAPETFADLTAPTHPDDQAIIDLAHAAADEVEAVLTRHGVQDFQRGDVLQKLSDLYTWVGESDPNGD